MASGTPAGELPSAEPRGRRATEPFERGPRPSGVRHEPDGNPRPRERGGGAEGGAREGLRRDPSRRRRVLPGLRPLGVRVPGPGRRRRHDPRGPGPRAGRVPKPRPSDGPDVDEYLPRGPCRWQRGVLRHPRSARPCRLTESLRRVGRTSLSLRNLEASGPLLTTGGHMVKRGKLPGAYEWLRHEYPDGAKAYEQLGTAVHGAGPLDDRTRALVKLAISVGAGGGGGARAPPREAAGAGAALTWVRDGLEKGRRAGAPRNRSRFPESRIVI